MFKILVAILCLAVLTIVTATDQISNHQDNHRNSKGIFTGWNIFENGKRFCLGLNGQVGTCMDESECSEINGKSMSGCLKYGGTCCSVSTRTCSGFSSLNTVYFENPEIFHESCSYKINIKKNTCQIRIDFEKFSLHQPTQQNNKSAYTCKRDQFTLTLNDNTNLKLPVLCGENSGQHVYVPVNQNTVFGSNNKQQLTINFKLTARNDEDINPSWKLKISQLECQIKSNNLWKINADLFPLRVWDREDERRDSSKFHYSLAPEGCLQYFTENDGVFESLNYNRGSGNYLGGLNYAVCFKRNLNTCGIKYKVIKFQIGESRNNSTDQDCHIVGNDNSETTSMSPNQSTTTTSTQTTTTTTPTTTSTQTTTTQSNRRSINEKRIKRSEEYQSTVRSDYLLIPDGHFGKLSASKYCGDSLKNGTEVIVKTQGLFYVAFVSDDYSNDANLEKGFKLHYTLINNC